MTASVVDAEPTHQTLSELLARDFPGIVVSPSGPSYGVHTLKYDAQLSDGTALLVKLHQDGPARLMREAAVMRAARVASTALTTAIPEVYLVSTLVAEDPHTPGVMVLEKRQGTPLVDVKSETERTHIWQETGRLVRELHSCVAPERRKDTEELTQEIAQFVELQLAEDHLRAITTHAILPPYLIQTLKDRLKSFRNIEPLPSCFCHRDINAWNLLFDRTSGQLTILDWEHGGDSHLLGPYNDFVDMCFPIKACKEYVAFRAGYGVHEAEFEAHGLRSLIDTYQATLVLHYAVRFARENKTKRLALARSVLQRLLSPAHTLTR